MQFQIDLTKVYPRACGGTLSIVNYVWEDQGLSPRLRGNRSIKATAKRLRRSIPAPAGEPSRTSDRRIQRWVYPRACGGTVNQQITAEMVHGLSPRLRGNLLLA